MSIFENAIAKEDLPGLKFILFEQPVLFDDILDCGMTVRDKTIELGFYEAIMKHLAKKVLK